MSLIGRVVGVWMIAAVVLVAVPAGSAGQEPAAEEIGVGLVDFDARVMTQRAPALSEAGDRYGSAIAAADFNGDGVVDVAAAAPEESFPGIDAAGAVLVTYSAPAHPVSYPVVVGLRRLYAESLYQLGVQPGKAEEGDRFGEVLATGDFDGDGFSDLAVGAPREGLGPLVDAGAVTLYFGSPNGLRERAPLLLFESMTGIYLSETGDWFGAALTAGDFDGDGRDELVVGGPHDTVLDQELAGMVSVFSFDTAGDIAATAQIYRGGGSLGDWSGSPEAGERFAAELTATDMNADGHDDLVVGAPGATASTASTAGAVYVIKGSAAGLMVDDVQRITHTEPSESAGFGSAFAVDPLNPNRVAVGSPNRTVDGTVGVGSVEMVDLTDASMHTVATGTPSRGEGQHFGAVLAMADLNNDGESEVLVGLPLWGSNNKAGAGVLATFSLAEGSEDQYSSRFYDQAEFDENLAVEAGDNFAASIVVVDFGNNGLPNLVIGSPGEGLAADNAEAGVIFPTRDWINDQGVSNVIYLETNPGTAAQVPLEISGVPAVGTVTIRMCPDLWRGYREYQGTPFTEIDAACGDTVASFEADLAQSSGEEVLIQLNEPVPGIGLNFLLEGPGVMYRELVWVRFPDTSAGTSSDTLQPGLRNVDLEGEGWTPNSQVELRYCTDVDYGERPDFDGRCDADTAVFVTIDANGDLAATLTLDVPRYDDAYVGVRDSVGRIEFARLQTLWPTLRLETRRVPGSGQWDITITGSNYNGPEQVAIIACTGYDSSHPTESHSLPPNCIADDIANAIPAPVTDGRISVVVPVTADGEAGATVVAVLGPPDSPVYVVKGRVSVAPASVSGHLYYDELLELQIGVRGSNWFRGRRVDVLVCPGASMDLPLDQHLATCDPDPVTSRYPDFRGRFSEFGLPFEGGLAPVSIVAVASEPNLVLARALVEPPNPTFIHSPTDSLGEQTVTLDSAGWGEETVDILLCGWGTGCRGAQRLSVEPVQGRFSVDVDITLPRGGVYVRMTDGETTISGSIRVEAP